MPYTDYYKLADDTINHLNSIIPGINDPLIISKYVGFVSITAVTVYELAIKDIFISFSLQKHKILGNFSRSFFERINGRIKIKMLKDDYIKRFGENYVKRFDRKIDSQEKIFLKSHHISIKNSYTNVIEWRNSFAHEGVIPNTVTFREIVESYETGKKIIECLATSMKR